MKKERSINELLKLMLGNQEYFNYGLCRWVDHMKWHDRITWDEMRKIRKYIKENRPKNFYWLIGDDYYWKYSDINPRIKWLQKHIKLTNK